MPDDRSRRGPSRPRQDALHVMRVNDPSIGRPVWEFVHPRCARRRREDLQEVEGMLDAGEIDIARDELVWLLSECPDFLEAHVHLGMIALEDGDPKLARGHFGRGYELGVRAIDAAGNPAPIPCDRPANRPFYEAAKGLVHCLQAMKRARLARDIGQRIARLDPPDTLGIVKLARRDPSTS